jgi:glycerol-3-phosphate acyltransferase PlsY
MDRGEGAVAVDAVVIRVQDHDGFYLGTCRYFFGSIPAGLPDHHDTSRKGYPELGFGQHRGDNVSRFVGKGWGVGVALFDMAKGGLVVLAASLAGIQDPWILALSGFAGSLRSQFSLSGQVQRRQGGRHIFGVVFFLEPGPCKAAGGIVVGTWP